MNDGHIINLLDEKKFSDLSETEIQTIEAHIENCVSCRSEYEAAAIASVLLRERAAVTIEPPPFFETRVLNAWRERQAELMPAAERLRQMWQDVKLLVSGLTAAVAALLAVTFFVPQINGDAPLRASFTDYYTVESVIFERPSIPENLSDEQLLGEIYGGDELEKSDE
jgi:predicted anti-sigma-YlaC factor YlaD